MSKLKIYEGIACLEIESSLGHLWWYQPGKLAYTPVEIKDIKRLVVGKTGRRDVLAVPIQLGSQKTMVALNMPRTDVWTLKQLGLLPPNYKVPAEKPAYTPWPEYAGK